jgi:hypothetical protein
LQTLEIRGRDQRWKVFYPDEAAASSPVHVYDRDGVVKDTVWVAGPARDGAMTETHFVGTESEAEAYARFLSPGCEIKRVQTTSQSEALARARAAKAQHVDRGEE